MRQFTALIKREYWEWKRVILWSIGIFAFLLLLMLIPINRMSNNIESWVENKGLWCDDEKSYSVNFDGDELTKDEIDSILKLSVERMNITEEGIKSLDSLIAHSKQTTKKKLTESPITVIKPYSYGILAGFSMIQLFVIFIALFYFSDSLYKERSNNSTLFFRSLPLNDHWILLSKLKAGGIGIIGLTIIMLVILLAFSRIAIMTASGDIWDIISGPIGQINMLDLFWDLILYQIVSLLWLCPLILFMMFVSATVKNRPLIVGIGVPLLLAITLQVIYGENAFVTQIGDIFGAIAEMISRQNLITDMTVVPPGGVNLFGSFFGDLFSVRTVLSLLVGGLFYTATWLMYRKNISTN